MMALAIAGTLLVVALGSVSYHTAIGIRHETITVATTLARTLFRQLEKDQRSGGGRFSPPFNEYQYQTYLKNTSYPQLMEGGVQVRRGNEAVTVYGFISTE